MEPESIQNSHRSPNQQPIGAEMPRQPEGEAKLSWKLVHVTTADELRVLANQSQLVKEFSLDTETGGAADRGEALDTHLSLLQIGVPHEEGSGVVYLIDVLALQAGEQNAQVLAPLKSTLESGAQLKVAHHAEFETRQLAKQGIRLAHVLDTEQLAKELQLGLLSYSLAACCREFLRLRVGKQEQKSDFLRRPLSQSQIEYAALDAEVTWKLASVLRQLRCEAGRGASFEREDLQGRYVRELVRFRQAVSGEFAFRLASLELRAQHAERKLEDLLRANWDSQQQRVEVRSEGAGSAFLSAWPRTELDAEKLMRSQPALCAELLTNAVSDGSLRLVGRTMGYSAEELTQFLAAPSSSVRTSYELNAQSVQQLPEWYPRSQRGEARLYERSSEQIGAFLNLCQEILPEQASGEDRVTVMLYLRAFGAVSSRGADAASLAEAFSQLRDRLKQIDLQAQQALPETAPELLAEIASSRAERQRYISLGLPMQLRLSAKRRELLRELESAHLRADLALSGADERHIDTAWGRLSACHVSSTAVNGTRLIEQAPNLAAELLRRFVRPYALVEEFKLRGARSEGAQAMVREYEIQLRGKNGEPLYSTPRFRAYPKYAAYLI